MQLMANAKIKIEGEDRELRKVAVRHMNFGQHWRTLGVRDFAYEIKIPHACLRSVLEAELNEIIEDARQFPDDDAEFTMVLRMHNWPSVNEILENPKLREAALSYFAFEVLQVSVSDSPVSEGWILNTISHTSYEKEHLRIVGLSARASELQAYQDI